MLRHAKFCIFESIAFSTSVLTTLHQKMAHMWQFQYITPVLLQYLTTQEKLYRIAVQIQRPDSTRFDNEYATAFNFNVLYDIYRNATLID